MQIFFFWILTTLILFFISELIDHILNNKKEQKYKEQHKHNYYRAIKRNRAEYFAKNFEELNTRYN